LATEDARQFLWNFNDFYKFNSVMDHPEYGTMHILRGGVNKVLSTIFPSKEKKQQEKRRH
jgi:hypothetical protein